ncbi:hypothetical protein scyTo_0024245, partial [Scyliorhinus torazame]|nr:hypothetical protein [Scyliorhinus torazame]
RQCGCCWAFGVVANIESMWFIKTKQLLELSEQELVDCDTLDLACKGGYPYNAFNSIIKLGKETSPRKEMDRVGEGGLAFAIQ